MYKKDRKKQHVFIAFIFLFILMAFLNAYNLNPYADFYPLNGDFQNYNPIRRFLCGQRPFVDFEVYLGMGHLLAGSFFTFLLGNNFQASLYAMRIVTFLAFELTVYIISLSILEDRKSASLLTLLVSALNLIGFGELLPVNLNVILSDSLRSILEGTRYPGNSARMIRSLICVIAPTIAIGFSQKAKAYLLKKNKDISQKTIEYIESSIWGGSWDNNILGE